MIRLPVSNFFTYPLQEIFQDTSVFICKQVFPETFLIAIVIAIAKKKPGSDLKVNQIQIDMINL